MYNKAERPIFLVSGLSGAGKSTALQVFEDLNFFTADGLPTSLIHEFTRLVDKPDMQHFKGIALGLDLRLVKKYTRPYCTDNIHTKINLKNNSNQLQNHFQTKQRPLNNSEYPENLIAHAPTLPPILCEEHAFFESLNGCKIIFLEANNHCIIKRYASTRRPHPLEIEGLTLETAIIQERQNLDIFRQRADIIFDTSNFTLHDLRRAIQHRFGNTQSDFSCMHINLMSFGFKYGLPQEADMVFDVRFLPNPYFDDELRSFSGLNPNIVDFVFKEEKSHVFRDKLVEHLHFMLPYYQNEGRYKICIAIGCTGGRHRSVAVAEFLYAELIRAGYTITLEHKHLQNDRY